MTRITVACLDMAGTTVADDGTVLEAFAAAVGDLPGDAFERAMTAVRSSMGQSKIEVFRRILGDEAAARKANEAFEDHYAAAVRGGGISAVPGAEDTIMRLRDAGVRVCLATGFSPVTRDAIIGELAWGGLIDLALSPADAGRGRPWPDLPVTALLRLRRDRGRRADRRQHPRRPRAGRRSAHPRHDRGHPPLYRQLTRRAATSTGWAGSDTATDAPAASAAASALGRSTWTATSPDNWTPTLVTEPRNVLVVTIPLPFSTTSSRSPSGRTSTSTALWTRRCPRTGIALPSTAT